MSFLFSPMGNPLLGDSMREYIFVFFGALKQIQMFNGIGSFSPELSGKNKYSLRHVLWLGKN